MAKRAPKDEVAYRPLLNSDIISQLQPKEPPQPPALKVEDRANTVTRTITRPESVFQRRTSASNAASAAPPAQPGTFPVVAEKIDQEKRMLITKKESDALERAVRMLAARLNTQIKLSHVLRALMFLLLNAEADLDRRAGEVGALIRPPNGDVNGIREFDKQIAKVISKALRDAAPRLEADI